MDELLKNTVSAENYLKAVEGKLVMSKRSDGEPEIFHTIQGEGPRTGHPVVFMRLSGCNLNCSWCDTAYTWNWNEFEQEREQMWYSIEDAAEKIRAFNCRSLVVTGGEPTLQFGPLIKLFALLRSDGEKWFIELETNGSRIPTDELMEAVDEFNCSPKLAHSSNMKNRAYNEEALKKHVLAGKTIFKFVMSSPTDLAEVLEFQQAVDIPSSKIYIMPEGKLANSIQDKMPWVVELCKQYGFIACNRLHVMIWGAKRGV